MTEQDESRKSLESQPAHEHSEAVAKQFRFLALVAGTVLVSWLAIAFGVPSLIALYEGRSRYLSATGLENLPQPKYWLVIIRYGEQMRATDLRPFRNSRVACYWRASDGKMFNLVGGPLPMRTESTSLFPPLAAFDERDISDWMKVNKKYSFGSESVPEGFYWCTWRKAPEARRKYALMISDAGSLNGRITLTTTETLTVCTAFATTSTAAGEMVPLDPEIHQSRRKSGCYIHESSHQAWSHCDSLGCMNLLEFPEFGQQESAWETFTSWFADYRLDRDGPILLSVLRAEHAQFLEPFPPSHLDPATQQKLKRDPRLERGKP